MSKETTRINCSRVLAIDPAPRGFGFAVMEGPKRLVDWGIKEVRKDKNMVCRRKIRDLVKLYRPDVVVVEDVHTAGSRRWLRVRRLIQSITVLAEKHQIATAQITRNQVRRRFSGERTVNKNRIAAAIAWELPELAPRLPPRRRCWMPEDYRIHVFDAVSFALTFYRRTGKPTLLNRSKST